MGFMLNQALPLPNSNYSVLEGWSVNLERSSLPSSHKKIVASLTPLKEEDTQGA